MSRRWYPGATLVNFDEWKQVRYHRRFMKHFRKTLTESKPPYNLKFEYKLPKRRWGNFRYVSFQEWQYQRIFRELDREHANERLEELEKDDNWNLDRLYCLENHVTGIIENNNNYYTIELKSTFDAFSLKIGNIEIYKEGLFPEENQNEKDE